MGNKIVYYCSMFMAYIWCPVCFAATLLGLTQELLVMNFPMIVLDLLVVLYLSGYGYYAYNKLDTLKKEIACCR